MFSRMRTIQFSRNCSDKISDLKNALASADAVVIGAGAGLSTSAGFAYDGERFKTYFSDFEAKYGFHDMYTDHCFQKAGFDKKWLFYTQGDYGLFQCSEPCCKEIFENEEMICSMMEQQKDMKIPSGLLPVCPHCGKPVTMNLRSDNKFVEDEGWHKAAKRYELFLRRHQDMRILFLELGVGYNTPGIIKFEFWRMTAEKPKAAYACVNLGEACTPTEIRDRSICINADIGKVLEQL